MPFGKFKSRKENDIMHDLYELSAEISAVAMIVGGLRNQLDNEQTDTLTPKAMRDALFGVQTYLERIAADMDTLNNESAAKKGGAAA